MRLDKIAGSWLSRQWRVSLVPALIALVVVIVAGIFADGQNRQVAEERLRSRVVDQVALIRAKLEGNINGNIQLVRGLVSTISTEPDMSATRFNALAESLFAQQSQLRSVAVAPDMVVTMTFPLAGNEQVIGLDYMANPVQREAAVRARDSGSMVLAGPVDLVQGGRGFVARFPIFNRSADGPAFWGLLAAVVDADRLYADSGLLDPDLPIEIAISGRDALGADGLHFFGDPAIFRDDPVQATVILPSGTWQIAAIPRGGWAEADTGSWWLRAAIAMAGLLVLIPILIAGRLMDERQEHVAALRQREAQLARLSRRLELALDTSKVGVWEMDLVTRELFWDDRMNELYGQPPDGGPRTYDHWHSAIHPDDLEQAIADFNRALETGDYQCEFRIVLPDGSVKMVRTIGAVYADQGTNPRILGVNWDVTADVARNEDLQRAQRLTEARNRQLEAAKARIEHNSLHDSLTGLPNRRYLDEVLNGRKGTILSKPSVALLHIDLDRFKQINDTLGHAAGDAVLVHVARVLVESVAARDFVARIGGDEFVILCPAEEGVEGLAELAGKVVSQLRRPIIYEGHDCRCGVSVGIALEAGPDRDARRLLVNADIALYRAKGRGRNRYEFFSDALQAEVVTTKRLADEILVALEHGEFTAHYQPQFDAHTHEVVGVEALARWRHPRDGLKGPDTFLGIAEDLNVVASIDRLILEESLAQLAAWRADGIAVPRISVNVSLKRLHDEDLIRGLRELDITPGSVSFELVESIYLDESDEIVGWNIDQLKELGIDIEIDDFGTGYASIVSLQKLRPKRLKIDRQLVDPIVVDLGQRRLLASIVDIGKSLGIEVLAEGVETLEHARVLAELGCDTLQGYAFARPMPPDALAAFLRERAWLKAS
jgi:diguanylate cyclase (GGDEF)-like protein